VTHPKQFFPSMGITAGVPKKSHIHDDMIPLVILERKKN